MSVSEKDEHNIATLSYFQISKLAFGNFPGGPEDSMIVVILPIHFSKSDLPPPFTVSASTVRHWQTSGRIKFKKSV